MAVRKPLYSFTVDLSRVAASGAAVATDPELRRLVDEGQEPKLKLRAIAIGPAIRLESSWEKDLELCLPGNGCAESALSRQVEFSVSAVKEGCGAVAISVFDGSGLRPLDHFVRSIAVGGPLDCSLNSAGQQAEASFGSMLRSVSPRESADAALHIFETGSSDPGAKAVAVYVDRAAYALGSPDAPLEERGVFSWTLSQEVSHFLKVALPPALAEVHRSSSAAAYAVIAKEIRDVIFIQSEEPERRAPADRALSALQRLAKVPAGRIVARATAETGENLYFPLGLLAAGGGDGALANPITVIQPLPYQAELPPDACVDTWTFSVPKSLETVGQVEFPKDPLNTDPVLGPGMTRLFTLDQLAAYLKPPAATEPARKGEGLLILAHQDGGMLYHDSKARHLTTGMMTRRYPPGTAIILAVCQGAGLSYDHDIMDRLAERGVNTIVASPFPVPSSFAMAIASELADILPGEWARDPSPDLATVFKAAAARVGKPELAMEFVIAGHSALPLCKKGARP